LTSAVERHLVALPPTFVRHEWFTPFVPCIGVDAIIAVWKQRNAGANFRGVPVYQCAAVRMDKPGAVQSLTGVNAQAGNGEWPTGSVTISSVTVNNFFIRFGMEFDVSSGTAPQEADVTLQIAYDQCGRVLGSRSLDLSTVTLSDASIPITGWVPAIHANAVMAAVIAKSLSGNVQYRLTYRTASTSIEDASAWSTTFDSYRTTAEWNSTTGLTLSLGTNMWVQFGIQYSNSAVPSLGQATIDVVTGIRS
jgi:hypothetical protein